MNSPLGIIKNLIRKIPYVKEYYTSDHGDSTLDHIGMSFIFALATYHWWWLYLASWVYHAIFIELVWDTLIKKKNDIRITVKIIHGSLVTNGYRSELNWNAVIAQCLERSIGHVICLPVLIWRLLG